MAHADAGRQRRCLCSELLDELNALIATRQFPNRSFQGLEGSRVQDVDRPAHVEALPQPARARRPRVQVEPGRLVPRSERLDGIAANCRRRRDVGQRSSVRSSEP